VYTGLPQAAVPQQSPDFVASEPDLVEDTFWAGEDAFWDGEDAFWDGNDASSALLGRSILNESSAHAAFPISAQRAMRNTTITEVARIKRFCN